MEVAGLHLKYIKTLKAHKNQPLTLKKQHALSALRGIALQHTVLGSHPWNSTPELAPLFRVSRESQSQHHLWPPPDLWTFLHLKTVTPRDTLSNICSLVWNYPLGDRSSLSKPHTSPTLSLSRAGNWNQWTVLSSYFSPPADWVPWG